MTASAARTEETCPACGYPHDLAPLNERNRTVPGGTRLSSVSAILVELGTLAWTEDGAHGLVWLTPLGVMLADSIFEGCAPSPDADAAAVVDAVKAIPPRLATTLMGRWRAARTPPDAARELFAFAETCPETIGGQTALTLAAVAVGPDAIEAWDELAGRPGFGVYGRMWLARFGAPVAEQPTDQAWLAVDSVLQAMWRDPDGLADRVRLVAERASLAIDLLTDAMETCGHPGAELVIAEIRKLTR